MKGIIFKSLKEFLRPEFVGRVDEIIVFKPLTVEDYAKIADLMLREMAEALAEQNIILDWDEKSLCWIAEKAHGQKYGARDIRRVLRDHVEDPIASCIINGTMKGKSLHIRAAEDGITVTDAETD